MASMSLKSSARPMAILRRSTSKRVDELRVDSLSNSHRSARVLSRASTVEDSDLDLEEGEIREEAPPSHKLEHGYGFPQPRSAFPDPANKRESYADALDNRTPSRSIPQNPREDREYAPSSWRNNNSVSTSIPYASSPGYQGRTPVDTYRPDVSYEPSSYNNNGHGSSFDDRSDFCGMAGNRRDSRRDSTASTACFSTTEPLRPRNRIGKPTRRDSRLSHASYHRSIKAYSELSQGQSVRVSMRPSDKYRGAGEIVQGMIVSAPHHTQAHQDTVDPADENVSFTEFGPVHSKYRKLIVVAIWAQHFDCLPLYSYNGRGLENRENHANEYMHIREYARHDEYEKELGTSRQPLKATRDVWWKGGFINSSTVVKLTECCILYKRDKCSLEGYLTEDSLCQVNDALLKNLQSKVSAKKKRVSH